MPEPGARALPRGPHKLSREEVEASQRQRLLAAATEAVAEKGYVATSVADVLRRAGVSRTTFYRMFTDKQDCFLAALQVNADTVAALMEAELEAARAESPDPLVRLDRVLGTYLDLLHAAPALARVFLVDVYAAGPEAIEQRRRTLDRFVDIVAETYRGSRGPLGTAPEQRMAAEVLVGAVSSMVTNAVGAGDVEALPAMRRPLMQLAERILGHGD
ncbi:MAG TPA: helix-turn-helix domain-containing protein [Acidimicrobiales bacterium]|nr:helix-turn-helix domain-containing protein [Acidimicrobiales bacterium]